MTPKLREKTVLRPAPSVQSGFSLISNEKLLQLYATMLKCRMIEDRISILIELNKSAANHASWGQEAASAGLTIDLLPGDGIATNPGNIIPSFINGLPLETLVRGLFNTTAPASRKADPFKSATDTAMVNKLASKNGVTVALCSDSASLDSWQRALGIATLKDLPLIFLSWNHAPLKKNAESLPTINVDGSDVVAVYRVASESIAHARTGNGPTLIECKTDRQNPGDPILNMEKYLTRKGLFSEEFKHGIAAKFSSELDAAMEATQH